MYVRAKNIGAPGDNQARVAELLGLGAVAQAERLGETRGAGGCADGAVEPRGAQAVEKAAVHAVALQQAHGAAVTVGQDGFGAGLGGDGAEPRGDFVERFVPTDAFKTAFAFAANAPLRIEQAQRRIFALQILRHFAAQEAPRHRMRRVAAQFCAPPIFHRDQQ